MSKHYYERSKFSEFQSNTTYHRLLEMTDDEFISWAKLLRIEVTKQWDTDGVPPVIGKDKNDIIDSFKKLKTNDCDFLQKDLTGDDNSLGILQNFNKDASAVNQFFPTMLKTKISIGKSANLMSEARKLAGLKKNALVIVDTSFAKTFSGLTRLKSNLFKSDKSVIFVLSATNPTSYSIEAKHEITEMPLANVVGVLPGKSRPDEIVIFSGHYDHLGITSKDRNGNVLTDSIFNGANDDAAGTTAMMVLAKYFKALGNNERTLVFAAFTAEEVGGFGATYFSNQLDPAKVIAMFNLEMIGSESKWGKNSAFITGYEKTDMGKILQANLEGTDFTFYPDPYPAQNLFYRSDNATLARLGVPAHTISTTKIDTDPYYHKASDEIGTIDIDNMTRIIKAIALSARGIVSGKDTPTRVNTADLK
mgnify:CR=1 FL=1